MITHRIRVELSCRLRMSPKVTENDPKHAGEAPESPRYEERYPSVMKVHLEAPEPGVPPSMSEKYGLPVGLQSVACHLPLLW